MNQPLKRSSGFSIIELLVAVIIIGLLVAVIVPILSMRTKEAQQQAAKSDMQHIQDAQERAAVDTGFFYRLYVLDDDWAGDGYGFGDPLDIRDGLLDEASNRVYQNPRRIFIDIRTGEFLANADNFYDNNMLLANETAFNWHGRYITWQRDTNQDDIGNDPWGNNYLFFTKAGVVLEPDGTINTQYRATDNSSYDAMVFDRPTILSLGPDGLPGGYDSATQARTQFGTGDDLIRQF